MRTSSAADWQLSTADSRRIVAVQDLLTSPAWQVEVSVCLCSTSVTALAPFSTEPDYGLCIVAAESGQPVQHTLWYPSRLYSRAYL